jgi:hypothetical protein
MCLLFPLDEHVTFAGIFAVGSGDGGGEARLFGVYDEFGHFEADGHFIARVGWLGEN